jgi:hypothetical protein
MTMPSAPDRSQVGKVNAIYECGLELGQRAPHRRGRNLATGRAPRLFPLMVQGPLMLGLRRDDNRRPSMFMENGALTAAQPPSMGRLRLWARAAIAVRGRFDWVFVKLHCHGMDPRDESAMYGSALQRFLSELTAEARAGAFTLHFVTAREMVNVVLAACDGREGSPGE